MSNRSSRFIFSRPLRRTIRRARTPLRRAGALLESEKGEERVEGQKLLDAVFLMLPR
ncbi:MAG TPA: hypothetical protein VMS12_10000 [Thermoanaerobaculia bacterium]|nr:hypothetical protein [Thermoanaerobaculia bacterium]